MQTIEADMRVSTSDDRQQGSGLDGLLRPGKAIPLPQLRTIMHTVIDSKAQENRRRIELGEPKETMKQHLQNVLQAAYGDRANTVGAALARAIQRWAQRSARSLCSAR